MKRLCLFAYLATATLAGSAVNGATPAAVPPGHYDIQATIHDGNRPDAHPRLRGLEGAPATFQIADDRYSLTVEAIPYADGHVTLRSHIAAWTPQGIRNDAQTVRMQSDGAPHVLEFSYTNPGSGQVGQVRLALIVRPAA